MQLTKSFWVAVAVGVGVGVGAAALAALAPFQSWLYEHKTLSKPWMTIPPTLATSSLL